MSIYRHCGQPLLLDLSRLIPPTAQEAEQGITAIRIEIRQCKQFNAVKQCLCRKKHYFRQVEYSNGYVDELEYLKPKLYNSEIQDYRRRIMLAPDSDWVWGFDNITFQKVKRQVS